MNKIRTLIVDDEQLARSRMRRMLAAFDDLEIAGEAENGTAAVALIEAEQPDLLFLDVQMPDLNGFEVLRLIEPESALAQMPLVVFVTAFDQYAINAFEVSAIDYLLKPVHRERLQLAVKKTREKLDARKQAGAQLTQFLQTQRPPVTGYLQRLPVRSNNRILMLSIEQVTSFKVDRGLVCVTTAEGEHWTKYTALTELEALLDPKVFQRIHRQVIVNLNHVREITAFDNNTARLTLTGGAQVQVSRSHIKELREVLQW
ncbi:MAG: response regulator [Acidobacteriota bacterium]|nr:response regulator [Acidobacteriota bacterium]